MPSGISERSMAYEYGYQLTEKATADLDAAVSYIAGKLDNPQAATDFLEKLRKAIDEVRMFPESGSPIENEYLPHTGIRKKLVGNYILYYLPQPASKKITVLRILYGKRNIDQIIRQLNF